MSFEQNQSPSQEQTQGDKPVSVIVDQSSVVSGLQENLETLESIDGALSRVIYLDDADWTDSTSSHVLMGGLYQSSPQTVTDGDVAPIEIDVNGKIIESNSLAIKNAVETLDNIVSGSEAQVDIVAALPAGTNNIGDVDVASIAAGDNNIGNVDIASAIPAGTNTIGKVKLIDNYGFQPEFTPMDEMRVIEPVRLVGSTFVGATLDTNFWTATVTNDGTVVQGSGIVTLDSATTSANGTALLTSVAYARYLGSSSNRYRAQISLNNTGAADNTRNWGVRAGTTDGAYFQLSGTTVNIVTLKNSTPTAVASASWNGSTSVPTLTNCNTYEIYWTNKSVYFIINGTLMHTVTTTTATWADTLNFQVFAETINANSLQTSNTVVIRVNTIVRMGREHTSPRSYYYAPGTTTATVLKRGPGSLHRLIICQSTNGAVVTLWDGVAAATTTIFASGALTAKTDPSSIEFGIPFTTGLTLTVATQNASVVVVYE